MDRLAQAVAANPVLQRPNYDQPFFLEVDASQFATGAILSQKDERGRLRPVGSISHSFTLAERNYDIHDRELLAIIHGLRAWRHILLSSPHVVTIYTDHKNLTYYRHAQRIARQVARYLGELADYNFVLVHKPGTSNHADHLSRCPDYDTGSTDNENITVLPPHLFVNATDLLSMEQRVYDEQGEHEEQMKNLQKEHPLNLVDQKWFNRGRLVVPDKEELKREILRHFHDHELAGHPGIANTIMAVTWEFWWPEIRQFTTCLCTRVHRVSKYQAKHGAPQAAPDAHRV